MTAPPSVVAVILNWCGEHDTIACVESLERSTYQSLRLLIVDNASPDGSGARLAERFPQHAFLQTHANLGYAGGNNRGFERAFAEGADYVLVLNNDTVVDSHCVEWLVRTAESASAALVAPKILYFDAPNLVWFGGGDFLPNRALGRHRGEGVHDDARESTPVPITFATGCCFLVRAGVLQRVGGFDESYFAYVEDVELSLRIVRSGGTMLYEPRARLLHKIPVGKPRETPFQIRQRDRNRRRLARTHFGVLRRIGFASWFYPTRAVHFARFVGRGQWPEARAILTGAFGSLSSSSGEPAADIRTRPGP